MKTKLILASFAMVVLMVAAVGAGTLAYFSDTETIADNKFVAGTIDIDVPEPGLKQVLTMEGELDLKPCQVGYLGEIVTNVGTNPVDVWKRTVGVVDTGGLNPEPEVEFCMPVYSEPECACLKMSELIGYDLHVTRDIGSANPDWETIVDFNWDYTLTGCPTGVVGKYIYLGRLDPGETLVVRQSYHLSGDASNAYQGDVVTFKMEFFATQTVGSAPGPTPLLF